MHDNEMQAHQLSMRHLLIDTCFCLNTALAFFLRNDSFIAACYICNHDEQLPINCGADGVEEDEALARRLQEQEDALATRGRATRGALRVPQKPSQAVQKGSSRDARQPRGLASAGVRSSSRLKPQPTQGKQRPVKRGSTGMHTCDVCVCMCVNVCVK